VDEPGEAIGQIRNDDAQPSAALRGIRMPGRPSARFCANCSRMATVGFVLAT
jgi:hypothetical protein